MRDQGTLAGGEASCLAIMHLVRRSSPGHRRVPGYHPSSLHEPVSGGEHIAEFENHFARSVRRKQAKHAKHAKHESVVELGALKPARASTTLAECWVC